MKQPTRSLQKFPLPNILIYHKVIERNNSIHESASYPSEDITKVVEKRLATIWYKGGWGRDRQQYYQYLRGIQALKRNILEDKITLCRYALWARVHRAVGSDRAEVSRKARFLVVRRGVLRRALDYVARLRDHKNQVNKAMDSGAQDHPRPSVERRRELGIYMDFLSERTQDLERDMCILLDYTEVKGTRRHGGKKEPQIVLHGWAHEDMASFRSLQEVRSYRVMGEEPEEARFGYINTHVWMPERPDLQPVIAHEIAHAVIKDRFADLAELDFGVNEFTALLGEIYDAIDEYGRESDFPELRNDPYGILREIACDLLAIAVKGAAYVHALFLETIGFELEDLMCVQGGRLDLDMAEDWLANSDDTLRWGRRDWYFRLCLAVAWFHRIHHLPTEGRESSIDEHLLRGIGQIVEDFLDFLDKITPSQLKRTGPFWRHFANWLCDLVEILFSYDSFVEESRVVR